MPMVKFVHVTHVLRLRRLRETQLLVRLSEWTAGVSLRDKVELFVCGRSESFEFRALKERRRSENERTDEHARTYNTHTRTCRTHVACGCERASADGGGGGGRCWPLSSAASRNCSHTRTRSQVRTSTRTTGRNGRRIGRRHSCVQIDLTF